MRQKKETKLVVVEIEIWKKLDKDRQQFEKDIGGGKWSLSDAISEYQKIIKGEI